jgi:hypothetical protein
MGLSFLNKKTWHPGSFANIEKVWIAEQKRRELERKQIENTKKLKEERQIEELKKMQVEAGLIPSSHLQRLDWIYQGPECSSNITTAEEFLLGKPLKDEKEEKRHFTPVFQESYSNPQNEMFTRLHEDPMFHIKKEEFKNRKEIEDNPYRMKMILKEIEASIEKNQNDKKKNKKESKKSKRESSDSDSEDKYKYKNKSKDSRSKKDKKSKKEINITTPSMLKAKLAYGLIDKDGKTISSDTNKDLGPDRSLYKEYEKRKEDEAYYKKKKHGEDSYKKLSESEKEKLRNEMELKALHYDREKLKKIEDRTKSTIESSLNKLNNISQSPSQNLSVLNKPGFLKSIESDLYASGSMKLEEKLRRNKVNLSKDKY